MERATGDHGNRCPHEGVDQLRRVLILLVAVPEAAEGAGAPGVDQAVVGDRRVVGLAAGDTDDEDAVQAHSGLGDQGAALLAVPQATPVAVAPRVHVPLGRRRHRVLGARRHHGHHAAAHALHEPRRELYGAGGERR